MNEARPYSEERMLLRGLLAEEQVALRGIQIKAQGQVYLLRLKVRATADPLTLPVEEIVAAADELRRLALAGRETEAKIIRLKTELGES